MRITWIGHSGLLIEDVGIRAFADPILRNRVGHLRRLETYELEAIGGVDAALISHAHRDHLDLPSLRLLAPTTVVVPRTVGGIARKSGVANVVELAIGESTSIGALTVYATYARHSVRRNVVGSTTPALGYVLVGSQRLYFAGDTGLFSGMRDLAGDLDVAVLPIAGWGPRIPPDHLDPHRAAVALTLLRPRIAVPIHWGTLRRIGSREDAWRPVESFLRSAAKLAPEVNILVPTLGASVELEPSAELSSS